jgi:uncharacterized protein (DUF1778 family)
MKGWKYFSNFRCGRLGEEILCEDSSQRGVFSFRLCALLDLYGHLTYTNGVVDDSRGSVFMPGAGRGSRTTARNERLEARVSRETKELCQRAAQIQGSTLTEFVVNCAVEAAKRTVRENEFVELTRRDRVAFVEALLNPAPAPNAKLQKAVQRHARTFAG